MANGGKDVRLGDDKRRVSIVPKDEVNLYNIANGELLTDEFGTPLVSNVDQFFVLDNTAKRSTSVVFPKDAKDAYSREKFSTVGTFSAVTYGGNFDVRLSSATVLQVGGGNVGFGTTVGLAPDNTNFVPLNGKIISYPGRTTTGVTTAGAVDAASDFSISGINTAGIQVHDFVSVDGGNSTVTDGTVVNAIGIGTVFVDIAITGISTIGDGAIFTFARSSPATLKRILGFNFPYIDVKTISDQGGGVKNKLYFPDSVGISSIQNVQLYDKLEGAGIPAGTHVVDIYPSKIHLSNNVTSGIQTSAVTITRSSHEVNQADNVLRVAEQFKETSQVSNTLLGVNRAEVQLSLFSNVSSYGLNDEEFEFYTFNGGTSFSSWENRANAIYGNRYRASRKEEVQESAIRLEAFPAPYSYPYGPKFQRLGLYNADLFNRYLRFVELGNELYNYYDTGGGASLGYPADWKNKFLNPTKVYVSSGDVEYAAGITESFALVDTWTDTWRNIRDSILTDPVTGLPFTFSVINGLSLPSGSFGSDDTRPGYSDGNKRYSFLQSRRVFRYQPGRISGFTFGLKSSTEPVSGVTLEWGIKNPTDQYIFQIAAGQLKIIRRSTIPLPPSALKRSGLSALDQKFKSSGDPFDDEEYWTIEITRDKFNGDPLNGNGPSGYLIQPNKVTMYKIEFGWYGAIGARFYAYIPAGPGEARWVVVHTLVIENSMGSPCLEDSYFRLVYSLDVSKTSDIRTPQFLYKYGASYYIDGGDEGTSQIYSASSRVKSINKVDQRSLIGITPKEFLLNSVGTEIKNKKLIIPTKLNLTSDSLAEVKVVRCRACPGFAHVFTPGVATTETGKVVEVEFTGSNTLATINNTFFQPSDVGAKIIAPTIWNAYITDLADDTPVGSGKSFTSATIKGFPGITGYPTLATRDYNVEVFDSVAGITTNVGIGTYPHSVRLSNQNDSYVASDFKFTGSKIEILFLNPDRKDDYNHFADFSVGVTNFRPDFDIGSGTLNGFIIPGSGPGTGLTTILAKEDTLYAEHTHQFSTLDENGTEVGETWIRLRPRRRMDIDYRIPGLTGDSPGRCSKVTVEVLETSQITGLNQVQYVPTNPSVPTTDYYIFKQGTFPAGITYDGGNIKLTSAQQESTVKYVGVTSSYTDANGNVFEYIQISDSLGSPGNDFSVDIRPVKITANGNPVRQKLFNFNPFPLYFFAKLGDNAAINNITLKETSGSFQRTITPNLYKFGPNTEITLAGGNASTNQAPTNYLEVDRLSSSLVDKQNEQKLRPGSSVDTVFIGADQTKEIDMSKIFGQDRNVITPDNNNVEATFIVAKKLDSGSSGEIQATLNFKEQ